MNPLNSRLNLILLFISCQYLLIGQVSKYSASISKSYHSGYQKIKLSPELISLSKENLSDIRIWDKDHKQVPYFIIRSKPISKSESKKTKLSDMKLNRLPYESQYIISNKEKKIVDHLALDINNTSDSKYYSVYGSTDAKTWFSISSHQPMGYLTNSQSTTMEYIAYLPKTQYAYYKLTLNDSQTAPIVINQISIYNQSNWIESEKIKLTNLSLSYTTQGNDNIIQFSSKYRFRIDELKFNMLNKGLYNREFNISTIHRYKKSTVSEDVYQNALTEKSNLFSGINLTDTQFKIIIRNYDNQPLSIQSIDVYQYPIYLVASIDSLSDYIITTGDDLLHSPIYDIEHYRDSLSLNLHQLSISDMVESNVSTDIFSKSHFYQQKWFMWLSLALGVVVILFVSLKMIQSLNSKNEV